MRDTLCIGVSNFFVNIRRARWSVCWLLMLLQAAAALALSTGRPLRESSHQAWQSDTGLPQNTVHAIVQTRDGYLWVGTEGGLVRFDGIDFQVFDRSNTGSFPSDVVTALAEDAEGGLWVSTPAGLVLERAGVFSLAALAGQSLGVYRTRAGQLLALTPDGAFVAHGGSFTRLAGSERLGMTEGAALVAEGPSGEVVLAGASRVQKYTTQLAPAGSPLDIGEVGELAALAMDGSGTISVGGASGLGLFRQGQANGSVVPAVPSHDVTCLLPDAGGGLWIGTGKGLALYEHGAARAIGELAGARIERLFLDRAGTVWAATSRGLARITGGTVELSAPRRPLPEGVLSIFEDREGDMWFGTDTAGLHVLRDQPFWTLSMDDGLSSGLVRAIIEDHAGAMWFGTSGGLNRLEGGRVTAFAGRLPSRVVLALAESSRPSGKNPAAQMYDLWIGTPEGLLRYREDQSRLFTTADGLADDFVRSLYADRDGTLWVGTRNGLTHLVEGAAPRSYSRLDGLASDLVGAIVRGRDGTLWVGTLGGLSRFEGGHFVGVPVAGTPAVAVTALTEDSTGALWLGTEGGGLWRLRRGIASSVASLFAAKQPAGASAAAGLPATVYGMLEDGDGALWLSSRTGIDRVPIAALDAALDAMTDAGAAEAHRQVLPIEHYGTADGMRIREASGGGHPAAWRAHDGSLWFATLDGAAVTHPQVKGTVPGPPPLAAIEQVSVNDEALPAPAAAQGGASITVPPGQGRLSIRYAGLSFLSPQQVRYRYMLAGFDRSWVEAGTRRTAFYTNVPPGTYRFMVAASNSPGIWSTNPAEVRFAIKPYLYQTWWFYALLLCALAGLSWATYRWRVHRLQAQVGAQYRAVLEERSRIAREIHDTLAQGYVAVSVQLELAERLLAHSVDAGLQQLRQTKELVREGLEEARSSIWNLRAQADAETLPALLAAHLSSRTERRGAHQREPVLRFAVHGAYRPLARPIEDEVRRIAQEAVANAISHAGAAAITVTLSYDAAKLALTVTDDGVGIGASWAGASLSSAGTSFHGRGHFGLQGMRERAAQIGATLTIEPGRNESSRAGTVITLIVPFGSNAGKDVS